MNSMILFENDKCRIFTGPIFYCIKEKVNKEIIVGGGGYVTCSRSLLGYLALKNDIPVNIVEILEGIRILCWSIDYCGYSRSMY